jgi:hypothetical protein
VQKITNRHTTSAGFVIMPGMHPTAKRLAACFATILTAFLTGFASTAAAAEAMRAELAPRISAVSPTPAVSARRASIAAALAQAIPIKTLASKLDARQQEAQAIALEDPRVAGFARAQPGNRPLQVEVFGVYPLRESDLAEPVAACKGQPCYRVEIYSFAANATLLVFVDVDKKLIVNLAELPRAQPDIPEHLTALALDIATNAPEVARALGGKPSPNSALMASTKTSLNRTRCERSRHLCVAPTFVQDKRALWVIVDLTDLRVVGTRWTEVGTTAGAAAPLRPVAPVTEARLQNQVLTEQFCDKETRLSRDGWSMGYMLTSSDGLRIANVKFKDEPVFDSVKLVDWHVSYSRKDAFGYSDAVGCPFFSQSAVIAAEPPRVEDIMVDGKRTGFALVQHFWSDGWPTPCNYYYIQRNEFYLDGRFRPMAASVGRGCGNDGTYRPVTRIAFSDRATFSEWDGKGWAAWPNERWQLADEKLPVNAEGNRYRISGIAGNAGSTPRGYLVAPSRGQFGDGGRGDNPYVYVTKRHADRDEGDGDLSTLGPCCNNNHEQGPEKFINKPPEPIADAKFVLWYVPLLKNDNREGKEYCWANTVIENGLIEPKTFPCFSGPMLTPVAAP